MNALSGAHVYVANQLFATLDTTTRRIELPSGRAALLSDTVGFIQKLPTTLIAAFRATLEGIIEADLILHVVDISNRHAKQHIETVEDTLAAIETPDIPQLLVLNKVDLLDEPVNPLDYFSEEFKSVVRVSAVTKQGLDVLLSEIEEQFKSAMSRYELLLPYNKGDVVAWVHENAIVEAEDHTEEGFRLTVNMPPRVAGNVEEFIIDSPEA
jgi:GTP-binding protein HflX